MKKLLMILMMFTTMFVAVETYASDIVNINTATVEQLQQVKGIGASTAAAIVAYRKSHGDFSSLKELMSVKGIGEKKLTLIQSGLIVKQAK